MWLISTGYDYEGGCIVLTLPATLTADEVQERMRALAFEREMTGNEWMAAELWEVNTTRALQSIKADLDTAALRALEDERYERLLREEEEENRSSDEG